MSCHSTMIVRCSDPAIRRKFGAFSPVLLLLLTVNLSGAFAGEPVVFIQIQRGLNQPNTEVLDDLGILREATFRHRGHNEKGAIPAKSFVLHLGGKANTWQKSDLFVRDWAPASPFERQYESMEFNLKYALFYYPKSTKKVRIVNGTLTQYSSELKGLKLKPTSTNELRQQCFRSGLSDLNRDISQVIARRIMKCDYHDEFNKAISRLHRTPWAFSNGPESGYGASRVRRRALGAREVQWVMRNPFPIAVKGTLNAFDAAANANPNAGPKKIDFVIAPKQSTTLVVAYSADETPRLARANIVDLIFEASNAKVVK